MIQVIQSNFRRFFTRGHERTVRARKNIFHSVIIKFGSVAISFLLIPLTIQYVNATNYGIWLTLSSIITWAALFDMGLGNGLKNKLAQDIALNKFTEAKSYVSSTYAIMIVIAALLFIAFSVINPYLNWQRILNVPYNAGLNLSSLVFIVFTFFCFQFVIQLINTVFTANQAPAKPALLNLIGQVFTLITVLFLIKYTQGSLLYLIISITAIPLLVMLIGSIWFYRGSYSTIAPSFSFINIKYAKELLSVGGSFFIIQIAALVMYESDNIVITQLFGPKEVTTFNIAYKLFSVILMFFVIIITPFWSAFTEAYAKQDHDWIKATLSKINRLWLALSICAIGLLIASPIIYRLWVGTSITVPFVLSLGMTFYTIAFIGQVIYVQFLNGIGKIKLQLYLGIVSSVINIPLSVFFRPEDGRGGHHYFKHYNFYCDGDIFLCSNQKNN